ncbi:hypothetical protein LINGRAHAP2_LOCUS30312 [Linum grandiflorum]
MEFEEPWIRYLPLVEFAYNNSYHNSIDVAPFKALYGRKCWTPLCWVKKLSGSCRDLKSFKRQPTESREFVLGSLWLKTGIRSIQTVGFERLSLRNVTRSISWTYHRKG